MNKTKTPIGLIFAMKEEQEGLESYIKNKQIHTIGRKTFIQGELWENNVVCAISGIGKVAAATTTTQLNMRFGVTRLILTGVAGSADASLRVGDVVIANELIQHDMNVFPLFPRFEVPSSNLSRFKTNNDINYLLKKASEKFFKEDFHQIIQKKTIEEFNLNQIQIASGLIASGDQFITDTQVLQQLKKDLPDLLALEMEGAAIAQVCHDLNIEFSILRTISDNANESAHIDFQSFIKTVASQYSLGILKNFFFELNKESKLKQK